MSCEIQHVVKPGRERNARTGRTDTKPPKRLDESSRHFCMEPDTNYFHSLSYHVTICNNLTPCKLTKVLKLNQQAEKVRLAT